MKKRKLVQEEIIYTASDKQLKSESYQRRLWIMMKNASLPRRAWLDLMADAFRDNNARIVWETGQEYLLPDIDDVFDCSEMRWVSDFLKSSHCGKKPHAKSRKLERLRLIDLYFKITCPTTAYSLKAPLLNYENKNQRKREQCKTKR